MELSVGVLIIGSLLWDPKRETWRRSRLRIENLTPVSAPIRYGRSSASRGHTYTMVFSRRCEPGQGQVARCAHVVSAASDLIDEAEHLWAAERNADRQSSISANWGSVALLCHPDRDIPQQLTDAWAVRVSKESQYGNVPQLPEEGCVVTERGLLQIPWPRMINGGEPLALDLLLATATRPTFAGKPLAYPNVDAIAAAWNGDPNGSVEYFWNNRDHGIGTFQDQAIRERLYQRP